LYLRGTDEEKLGVEIFFVKNDGYEFVEALLG